VSDPLAPLAAACVRQVNVSPGGVPKLPVDEAWVGRLGLDGDRHDDVTGHGGPHRAVTILGLEAIRRVAAEGHPIGPGTTGENLTIEGLDISTLPVGTRLAVGDTLLLELSKPTTPCQTIRGNFIGGHIARLSIDLHPRDSRMYARVLVEGLVRSGDPISVLPPTPDSRAEQYRLLERIGGAARASAVAIWEAARAGGLDVRYVDDGDLAYAAAPGIPSEMLNQAVGLDQLPHLLDRVEDHFRRHGTVGCLLSDELPPGRELWFELAVCAAEAGAVAEVPPPGSVTIRRIGSGDGAAWAEAHVSAFELEGPEVAAWPIIAAGLADRPHTALFLAEEGGQAVGAGSVTVRRGVAFLRSGGVVPGARGRGIQRALIAARVAHAVDVEEATLLSVDAEPGSVSARNLEAIGFERVGTVKAWRFDPAAEAGMTSRPTSEVAVAAPTSASGSGSTTG
jgi:MOSC domain-containing protein YiiM/ribosomal protein S18 acetylase RimI-like enzyme